MRNDPEVRQVVDQFQLGLPNTPVSGRSGELLGRGTGSSLEFQEHRDYLPGDDIRHLDWAAYARTDSLMIRMYREEISPTTQILLDTSRSMNTGSGQKSRMARQMAAAFGLMVAGLGARPSLLLLGEQIPPRELVGDELDLLSGLPLEHSGDFSDMIIRGQVPLKPKAARVVISDFLFPHDPATLIRRMAADSSLFWVVQVLTQFEQEPEVLGGRRLEDVESRDSFDMRINRVAIERYKKRLNRLQAQLRDEVRRSGGTFVTVIAEDGLARVCNHDLCRTGILRPR